MTSIAFLSSKRHNNNNNNNYEECAGNNMMMTMSDNFCIKTQYISFQNSFFNPILYSDPSSFSTPLDLSLKSSTTPITPPTTPSPCKSKDESINNVIKKKIKNKKQKLMGNKKLSNFEDKSSPVSGTIIRDRSEISSSPIAITKNGDIDPLYNVVEVTEEAKAELAKIKNKIGDYICKLCKNIFENAFCLAQHRCSCIVHVEYKCPECEKIFNCPANLASHRRWHKPRSETLLAKQSATKSSDDAEGEDSDELTQNHQMMIPCPICQKLFRKQAYLRKHIASQHQNFQTVYQPTPTQPQFGRFHQHIAAN